MTLVDCWNTIGVRGDGSCPELVQHIHCHRCPVYSNAAQALLDRKPPAEYEVDSTVHFAKPRPVVERATQSIVIFRIGSEWLALPTSVVMEIARPRQIHSLPHRRGDLSGVVNVHGELVVCVSLGRMLGLADTPASSGEAPRASKPRLLMIRREELRAVCPVDEVWGIHHFQPQQLQDVPATVAKSTTTYTRRVLPWREHSVGLLDDQLLFLSLKRSLA